MSKRLFFVFLIGVAVGTLGCYLTLRPSAKEVSPVALPAPTAPQAKEQSTAEHKYELFNTVRTREPAGPTKPVAGSDTLERSPAPTEARASVAPPTKQKLQIALTEEDVATLESQWSELPRQAEAELEDRGWRIKRLQPGSLLSTNGFKEGDLITTSSLQVFAQISDDPSLANRIAAILDHISR
jgi:hypothetical protein